MVYKPGEKYVVEGFCWVDVTPLPKSHFQVVGEPVDWSAKLTTSGLQPDRGDAVKFAFSCEKTGEHNINNPQVIDRCLRMVYLNIEFSK